MEKYYHQHEPHSKAAQYLAHLKKQLKKQNIFKVGTIEDDRSAARINNGKGAALSVNPGKADPIILQYQKYLNKLLISNNRHDSYLTARH